MSDALQIAEQTLLTDSGLTEKDLHKVLSTMASHRLDYADLYFQFSQQESWYLEDGIVKEGSYDIDRGVGVRAVSGEKTGFAFADSIHFNGLMKAAEAARSIAGSGGQLRIKDWQQAPVHRLYPKHNPLHSLSEQEKVALLKQIDQEARRLDPRITRVMTSIAGSYDVVLIAATDGTYAADIRPLVRMNVTVIAEQNGHREQGFAGGGGRYDYQHFMQNQLWKAFAHEAVRTALVNLEAKPAPAGSMDIVLGHGWPGVLLHEAVGHGLEGDFNRKGSSSFSSLIGKKVASEACTVVDDGTMMGRRGSLGIDDEGTPTQCTTLIENGILKGYMHDKMSARLMGAKPTGNGRRESYAHMPMPRMTNTYLLPGQHSPAEIIASVDKGLYAVNFSGGQVDITSGKFVFVVNEAYLIENGRITHPVRGATLIGDGPSALKRVSMVGNDLELDAGIGVCGKEGQSVPVGVGQPTLRINDITVGGTGG
jgi:TldD protein